MKDSSSTIKYSLVKILLPFLVIIIIPLFIILLIDKSKIIVNAKWDFYGIIIDFTKVNKHLYQGFLFLLLAIIIWLILKRNFRNKILYDGDVYGSYYWFFYLLAKFIGYEKISLKMIPLKIIILIKSKGYFEIVDHFDEVLSECKLNIDFVISKKEGSREQINIIISDTYPILDYHIPEQFHHFYHITFNRITKKGTRVFAKEFMDFVGDVINKCKEDKIKMNLFMTTSVSNTKYLFENYIMLGDRQYVNIEIFQMIDTDKPTRRFFEKGYVYKKGDKIMGVLKDLLNEYRVTRDFQKEIREGYRIEIEELLKKQYDTKCNFWYGGSLAKGTANINSCDIDLLTYLNNDTKMSLQEIYDKTYESLKNNYICEKKNSAITLTGKIGEEWDYNVDVVPGKFSSNDATSDVYLWQNNSKSRIKTNPEKQIKKIKESKSKDVIRLIKLYRDFNNFKFKSFFLEIFAVDVVESLYSENDSLLDKVIKFCSQYDKIGVQKINDPANTHNDIMDIHSKYEFSIIREKIKSLYEVLMTDNEKAIKDCILGKPYNIEKTYEENAFRYSIMRKPNYKIPIEGFIIGDSAKDSQGKQEKTPFFSHNVLKKGIEIRFVTYVPKSMGIQNVEWIITNSGYDAKKNKCLRGDEIEPSCFSEKVGDAKRYYKKEYTQYYGNHFVQAVLTTKSRKTFYSNLFVVKIR